MTSRAENRSIDSEAFRRVLGHMPTGVTVVTTLDDGVPIGLSCNSFTSVSLEPALVSFCAGCDSETWPRIRRIGRFTVNVLAEGQDELGRRFALKGVDRFAGVSWREGPLGTPHLGEAIAWIDCELHAEHPAGDHSIVLGLVRQLEANEAAPLVFFRGRYGTFSG